MNRPLACVLCVGIFVAECGADVASDARTSLGSTGNLWPNGDSEIAPAGTTVPNDGSSPEWDYRLNVGTAARSGSWVRHISTHGAVRALKLTLPAQQGDGFVMTAYGRRLSGSGNLNIDVIMHDANGAPTGSSANAISMGGTWSKMTTGPGPVNGDGTTTTAIFIVYTDDGTVGEFDDICVVRAGDVCH